MAATMSMSSVRVGATRTLAGKQTAQPTQPRVVCMAKLGNWLPGAESPEYLDGSLPGDYGFDPLSLGTESSSLARFSEAELMNGRWAMLAVLGSLSVELLGYGNFADAPLWAVTGGKATYFGNEIPFDLGTLAAVEFVAMAGAEIKRSEGTAEARKYPGGAFDPFGFSKDATKLAGLKDKEIKNGRLAMVAMIGFFAQHAATGKGPVAAWAEHVGNPWGANFATNGVSLPF